MHKGQILYNKAKKLIPGGTMLLSKRPEMFLPESWPSYFSKSLGCEVWDLEGKKFIDCSTMSVGTNSLGYSNYEVDDSVRKVLLNYDKYKEVAVKGRQHVIENFNWAKITRKYENIIQKQIREFGNADI